MVHKTKKKRKILASAAALGMVASLTLSIVLPEFDSARNASADNGAGSGITKLDNIGADLTGYFDSSVVQALPDTVVSDDEISVIVEMSTGSLLDAYSSGSKALAASSLGEYAVSSEGKKLAASIAQKSSALAARISKAGISYELGNHYDVLFSGFEVTIRAKDFEKLSAAVGDDATLIVGEVYAECETEVVENDVSVYDTGIFDSSDSDYDGSGTVIAVLDTGLDYTHTAFDVSRFEGAETLTIASLSSIVGKTRASSFTSDLSAEDVYLNKKVPYAYDYADKDPDVYPIQSEHGTHVSGVIVGNDDTITGVAPNAQLVSMKVFSDKADGAKTSWILAALEDCAILGVDVINMSLGSAAGFSRDVDGSEVNRIYDKIAEQGISLVCAASNSYNSTFGSEKNGNLGLTSNPDSATVGSPSTYAAALSVASVSGVKTPYMMYGNTVIYFTEASNQSAKSKNFVEEILPSGVDEQEFEYVTIPGIGRTSDYQGMDVRGKIALVKRGSTTFEEKARIAKNQGAAGIIIYNNVSGDISMTVGSVDVPVCSISRDNGELLAAQGGGKIKISRSQTAGPFMSNFSSWGPTPDLKIKPEITAHGGEILSSVPGQSYDRLSGTSMAAPNQAGVTALIRQYVKETFPELTPTEVTARVNQIMMSTTDIVYNQNGLPYSVRKQGSGLANLTKATTTNAFISTYDENGNVMDKAKLELGDDADRTGVYTMTFSVNNIGSSTLSYDVSAIVQTEGVSETLTNQGQTTVTEQGYLLNPAVSVKSVSGGSGSGNTVTVAAGQSADVTLEIRLSEQDKEYLEKSFANGMYVEGFVTLVSSDGSQVGLNVPFLAFYGDWTQAPLFDLDYFATNKDELDDSIDILDKTLPDAYATRPIGGLYNDYIAYLGSYAYTQDPSAVKISADRKYIALSNQATGDSGSTVHSIYAIWAGLLRNAAQIVATITDETTGEVIYEYTVYNQYKSYNYGGGIIQSSLKLDFDLANYNLKNNTQYLVKLQGYLDYGDGGLTTNLNNTFEFPFVTDFEAPSVTGCDFYTEYDATTKKTRLFAKIDIYDNHYSQAAYVGYITESEDGYTLNGCDKYLNALYSEFNSTYTLTYELTDHLDEIKSSYNGNSFVVEVIDYAMNTAVYELTIPDSVTSVYFADEADNKIEELTLSPNETYLLNPVVFPDESWAASLNYATSDGSVARVVNGKIIAVGPGTATVVACSNADPQVNATLSVTVLSEEDEGYVRYDQPVADSFTVTGYTIEKVFYFGSTSERDLGGTEAGQNIKFSGTNYALSMYPSESVTVEYTLKAYFPELTEVQFISSNDQIVTVDENGRITAVSEGVASVRISVLMNGKSTYYSQTININVKDPYTTNSIYLMKYTGNGGVVEIPSDLGVTEIYQYAFSNYEYVPKDETDEISEEDPYYSKAVPIGEDTITKVIIPEGVETIDRYAFAYLTALEEVVLPTTLKKIDLGAFMGCTSLTKINLEHVQFINQNAFYECPLNAEEALDFSSVTAIGDSAFAYSSLEVLTLPESAQSIGARAFYANENLVKVEINADKVKLGTEAFADCKVLGSIYVNASVVPAGVFDGCTSLTNVTLGADVSVIGAYAFRGTNVSFFTVAKGNVAGLTAGYDGQCLLGENGTKLILVAPGVLNFQPLTAEANQITTVGDGAFSGNSSLVSVNLPNVTKLGNYAFAGCSSLTSTKLTLGTLETIGDYAFYQCKNLKSTPSLAAVTYIGSYAFSGSAVTVVSIASDTVVGDYAFANCGALTFVTVGDDVVLGTGAFYAPLVTSQYTQYSGAVYYNNLVYNSSLIEVSIGDNATIGDRAFYGCSELATVQLGENASIGAYAFYDNSALTDIDLSGVVSVGDYAFAGSQLIFYQNLGGGVYYPFVVAGSYANRIPQADLSSAKSLGAGAFANAMGLTSVILGDIAEIKAYTFYFCSDLTDVDLSAVTSIGDYAFYYCDSLPVAELYCADAIGSNAFAYAQSLRVVALKDGVAIGSYAFYFNSEDYYYGGEEGATSSLDTINLESAAYIGDYAFYGAANLAEADLTSAVYVGEYAFMNSGITSVIFGTKLAYLGDNPFAGCALAAFADGDGNATFKVSEKASVIDGVLYYTAPNGGLVLITYPLLKTDSVFAIVEDTIRIGARAFAGTAVQTVELPLSLKAIGDKAFYGCDNLFLIVFKSLAAPILEEEYDTNYQLYTNLPQTGTVTSSTGAEFEGLGIVPYKMWNISSTIFYYGANFVNYIGQTNNTLVMVRPANGTSYDTFIYGQYFSAVVDGATAPSEETLKVIAMIAALPDYIQLSNEAEVAAAREAFDKLILEQQALVTNYSKLTSAEATIKYLKGLEEETPPDIDEPVENTFNYKPVIITLSVLTGVFAATTIAAGVVLLVITKKKKGLDSADNTEADSGEKNEDTD